MAVYNCQTVRHADAPQSCTVRKRILSCCRNLSRKFYRLQSLTFLERIPLYCLQPCSECHCLHTLTGLECIFPYGHKTVRQFQTGKPAVIERCVSDCLQCLREYHRFQRCNIPKGMAGYRSYPFRYRDCLYGTAVKRTDKRRIVCTQTVIRIVRCLPSCRIIDLRQLPTVIEDSPAHGRDAVRKLDAFQ